MKTKIKITLVMLMFAMGCASTPENKDLEKNIKEIEQEQIKADMEKTDVSKDPEDVSEINSDKPETPEIEPGKDPIDKEIIPDPETESISVPTIKIPIQHGLPVWLDSYKASGYLTFKSKTGSLDRVFLQEKEYQVRRDRSFGTKNILSSS